MQKALKTTVLFAFMISAAFAFSPRAPKISATNNVAADNAADKSTARDLFQQNCARCHGVDGTSETELGKLYGAPDLTGKKAQKMGKKQMTALIANGKGGMPAFKKKLNAVQVSALVGYVRSLK